MRIPPSRQPLKATVLTCALVAGAFAFATSANTVQAGQQEPSASATSPASETSPESVTLPAELARVLRDYETAWRARDAQGLAMLFSEDGYVLSGGRPPVVGREAIAERYANSGGSSLFLRAFHFRASGDIGYILGGYTYEEGGEDVGKFTLTLARNPDGRWLIASDMDNSNRRR